MTANPIRGGRSLRWILAAAGAASIAAAGLVVPAAPAAAAVMLTQQETVITNPAGEDWQVPEGVSTVYVGLRGGNGGNANRPGAGGAGAIMVLRVEVRPGDTLTVHAGKSATGKTDDERDGGLGYRRGGDGGSGSLTAVNGGGGGGAAALLRNGVLLAVAGGGGGAGGPENKRSRVSGDGANANIGRNTATSLAVRNIRPGWNNAATSESQMKGKDAQNLSFGGGGGGGGAGHPAGGTGGEGGGMTLIGHNSGAGGGAGGSWAGESSLVKRVSDAEKLPKNMQQYRGPVPEINTAKIVIPTPTKLTVLADKVIAPGEKASVDFQVAYSAGLRNDKALRGEVKLLSGSSNVGTYPANGNLRLHSEHGWVFGPGPQSIDLRSIGVHSFDATFSGYYGPEDYRYPEEQSTASFTVQVGSQLGGALYLEAHYDGVTPEPQVRVDTSRVSSDAPLTGETYRWTMYNGVWGPENSRDRGSRVRETGLQGLSYNVKPNQIGRSIEVELSSPDHGGKLVSNTLPLLYQASASLSVGTLNRVELPDDATVTYQFSGHSELAGKDITFQIDGRQVFTDRTDDLGVASIQLPQLKPGMHEVSASFLGDRTHRPVKKFSQKFEVIRAPQPLVLNGLAAQYQVGDTAELSVSGASGTGAVTYMSSDTSIAEIAGSTLNILQPGTFTITATKAADDVYAQASVTSAEVLTTPDSNTLFEDPQSLSGATIVLPAAPLTYSGAQLQPEVEVTYADGSRVEPADYIVGYGHNTTVAEGGTVTITGQRGASGEVSTSFPILPKPITVTAENEVKLFGEEDPELYWDAEPGLWPSDELSGNLMHTGIEVGQYEITQENPLQNPNYSVTFVPGKMLIRPNEKMEAAIDAIIGLPDPVADWNDADTVASAMNVVSELSDPELSQIPEALLEELVPAQSQAAAVNRSAMGGALRMSSAALPWFVRIQVASFAQGSAEQNAFVAGLASDRTLLALLDLSLIDTRTGDPWQLPSGHDVTLTLTGFPTNGVEDLRIDHAMLIGGMEQLALERHGDDLVFSTSSFSKFGITVQSLDATESRPGDSKNTDGQTATKNDEQLVNTGGANPTSWWLFAVIGVVAGAGLLLRKRFFARE